MTTDASARAMMLNEQQQLVVEAEGHVVCTAVPGSGKTQTVAAIIQRVMGEQIHRSRILGVTFTRLAAAEMADRVHRLTGAAPPAITTFHALCFDLIRDNWRSAGYSAPGITIYDSDEQRRLMKEAIQLARRRPPGITRMMRLLDLSGREIDPDDAPSPAEASALASYRRMLIEQNAIDYPTIAALGYQQLTPGMWDLIIVDEAQDLDELQHAFFRRAAPRQIVFVGDPNQSIYGWRGARPGYMDAEELGRSWPGIAARRLTVNYRSHEEILLAAGRVIAGEALSETAADRGPGGVVTVVEHPSEWLSGLSGSTAILGRTHSALAQAVYELRQGGVDVEVVGDRAKITQRPQIKAALAYTAWPEMPTNPILCERVLACEGVPRVDVERMRAEAKRRGTTPFAVARQSLKALDEFYEWADERISLVELVSMTVSHMKRLPSRPLEEFDRRALIRMASEFSRTQRWSRRTRPGTFYAWMVTREAADDVTDAPVQAMTIHAAKGLEFANVVIVGLDAAVFPSPRAPIDEERRLMFVAMTRARDTLRLVAGDSPFISAAIGQEDRP